jgi:rieske iron-sulfur protein
MASSTIAPFVDWGKFLPYTTPRVAVKARAELPDGTQANINTFPVNHSELVVVYPRSDDPVLYQEAFRTWQLIRLPAGLGGEKNGVSALRMFSIVYASISGACPGTESVDISSDLERRCKRHSRIR